MYKTCRPKNNLHRAKYSLLFINTFISSYYLSVLHDGKNDLYNSIKYFFGNHIEKENPYTSWRQRTIASIASDSTRRQIFNFFKEEIHFQVCKTNE